MAAADDFTMKVAGNEATSFGSQFLMLSDDRSEGVVELLLSKMAFNHENLSLFSFRGIVKYEAGKDDSRKPTIMQIRWIMVVQQALIP